MQRDDMKSMDMGLNLGLAVDFGSFVINGQYQLGLQNVSPVSKLMPKQKH